MNITKSKSGFTIIEMLLSLTFLALLVLLIGYVTIQIVNVYRKGVSVVEINKSADNIITDVSSSINRSGNISCALKKSSTEGLNQIDCVDLAKTSNVAAIGGSINSATSPAVAGAICTGKHSYIWNYGHAVMNATKDNSVTDVLHYASASDNNLRPARFLKVADIGGVICEGGVSNNDLTGLLSTNEHDELVTTNDRSLAIHSLAITTGIPDPATYQALYGIEFVLGTFMERLLMTNDAKCKNLRQAALGLSDSTPGGSSDEKIDETGLSYCAINKFNFTVRAIAGKGTW